MVLGFNGKEASMACSFLLAFLIQRSPGAQKPLCMQSENKVKDPELAAAVHTQHLQGVERIVIGYGGDLGPPVL